MHTLSAFPLNPTKVPRRVNRFCEAESDTERSEYGAPTTSNRASVALICQSILLRIRCHCPKTASRAYLAIQRNWVCLRGAGGPRWPRAPPKASRESGRILSGGAHEEQLESKTESGHLAGALDALCLENGGPNDAAGVYVSFGAGQVGKSWRRPPRWIPTFAPDLKSLELGTIILFFFYLYSSLPLFSGLPEVPAHSPTLFSEAGGSQGCLSFPASYRGRSCTRHSPRVNSTMFL